MSVSFTPSRPVAVSGQQVGLASVSPNDPNVASFLVVCLRAAFESEIAAVGGNGEFSSKFLIQLCYLGRTFGREIVPVDIRRIAEEVYRGIEQAGCIRNPLE